MALIALGVTGGIGAYKAVEVARGLQKRGHDVVAIMTRSATAFVGEVTFEAITRRRVITDQYARGANADIEHIALAIEHRAAARRAGHGQHHRQVRQRHRRRLPDVALPGHAGAGADGAGDEHQHAGARGGAAEHGDAGRARRALRRSRRRAIWRAAGSARAGWPSPRTIVAAADADAAAGTDRSLGTLRARHRGADLRGHRRGAVHRQPIERQDGVSRSPPRRRGAARGWCSSPGRRRSTPPAGVEVVRVRQRGRDARRGDGPRGGGRRRGHGRRRRRLHARRRRRGGKIEKTDAPLTLTLVRTPDILAELGACAGGNGSGPSWSASPPRRGDPVAARREKLRAEDRRPDRRQRRLAAADAGFDVGHERGDARQRRRRRGLAAAAQDRARRRASSTAPNGCSSAARALNIRFSVRCREQLAEHLRFCQELGVTGISRDAKWRRRRTPTPGRPGLEPAGDPSARWQTGATLTAEPVRDVARADRALALGGRGARRHPRGHRRLHALQAAHARADAGRVRRRQPERRPDVRRRGAGRGRRHPGNPVRRPRRPAADEDHRGDRPRRATTSTSRTSSSAGRRRIATPSRTKSRPASRSCSGRSTSIAPKVIVALGEVRGEDAAEDQRSDLAPARPRVRLSRRQADPDVPPGVPAAQPGTEARRLGRHEEGSRAPAGLRRRRVAASPQILETPVARSCPDLRCDTRHSRRRSGPVARRLTYRLPDDVPEPPIGARVLVPLGSRVLTGCVVSAPDRQPAAAEGEPGRALKTIIEVLDDEPFLPAEVVRLAAVGGRVLRLRRGRGARGGDAASRMDRERKARADHGGWPSSPADRARYPAAPSSTSSNERQAACASPHWNRTRRGAHARADDARARRTGVLTQPLKGQASAYRTSRVATLTAQGLEGRRRRRRAASARRAQRAALDLLQGCPEAWTLGTAARGIGSDTLARLAPWDSSPSRGAGRARPVRRRPPATPVATAGDADGRAGSGARAAGRAGAAHRFGAALLHGVTGSGKTEIYLRLASEVRATRARRADARARRSR